MQDPQRLPERTMHSANGPAWDRVQQEHGAGAWIPRDCVRTASTLTRRVQWTASPSQRTTVRTRGHVRGLWRLGCAWARVSACFRAASLVQAIVRSAAAVLWAMAAGGTVA